jgi:hypothetical protein
LTNAIIHQLVNFSVESNIDLMSSWLATMQ